MSTTTTVEIATPDGSADAYLVRPGGDGPFPGVLMFMDAFGLRPRLEEMAARIADRGYAVLVPNLLYRSGRPPLVDEVDTLHGTTSASYTDLTSVGPDVVIPLDGDYDVEWGAHSTGTTATAIQWVAVKRGSAATSDTYGIVQQPAGANYQSAGQTQRLMRMTACVAGDTYKLQYKTNAGTASFERRWLSATPVRVGA